MTEQPPETVELAEGQSTKLTAQQLLKQALANKTYNEFISFIPYAHLIGTQVISMGEELIFKLPERESNIGNLMLPAIHGGCIGGFMENAAALQIMFTLQTERIPKLIDFSIDFLRAGRKRDTYAQCIVVRQGRKIVNVSISAWQTLQAEPIATARAHFLVTA